MLQDKLWNYLPCLIFCMIVETISFHSKGNVDGINKDSIQFWTIQSVQKGIVVDLSSFFDMFCVSHAQSCRLSKFSMGCCIDYRSPLNKRFQRWIDSRNSKLIGLKLICFFNDMSSQKINHLFKLKFSMIIFLLLKIFLVCAHHQEK